LSADIPSPRWRPSAAQWREDLPFPLLLLTGATGLVGGEMLPLLTARGRVVALGRNRDKLAAMACIDGVSALAADLTAPDLGLDVSTLEWLAAGVTEIIHCAAETRFGLPLEQARAVNVDGTRRLLHLARRCRRLDRFACLSTVYVAGRKTGCIAESPISSPVEFSNTYQQSKFEAEELVLEAAGEIPVAIYRLSSIIGEAATGKVKQFNYVHQLLRLLPRNVLPVAPGDPKAPVDLIPSDWAAPALACLIERRFEPGAIYHLCAGPAGSLTVGELIDLTVGAFAAHPTGRQLGPIRLPRLASLQEYEEYVTQARRKGDRLMNELLRVLGYFLPHLALNQAFENRRATEALAASGLVLPPIRSYYSRVVHSCLDTNWGRGISTET
jgi:nucleoside-diphosphate-sugar epimerase